MITLSSSKKLALISAVLSVPLWAHADITGFNDPNLVQARQAYQNALRNQANAQNQVASAQQSVQQAQYTVNDAQNRVNYAANDLQNLVNQIGGDEGDVLQWRNNLIADIQRANAEIPMIQNNNIPVLNNQLQSLNAKLAGDQAIVPQKQAALNQAQNAYNQAQNALNQAQAQLQPAQAVLNQDNAQVQAAQQSVNQAQLSANSAQRELDAGNSEAARATADINGLNGAIQQAQNKMADDMAQIDKNNASIQTLSQVKPTDPNYKQAQAQIRVLQAQNSQLQHDVQSTQQLLNANRAALARAQAQLSQAQNMIADGNTKLAAANQQLVSANQALGTAQAKVQQQQQVVAPLQDVVNQRAAQTNQAQQALATAQTDLNAANGTITVDRQQIADTAAQLQQQQQLLQNDIALVNNGQQRLGQLDDMARRLHDAHARLAFTQNDLQNAQGMLQQAQNNLNLASTQYQNAQGIVQTSQQALDSVVQSEPIVYFQGAGGIGLAEGYNQTLQELTPALSGPNPNASGLTIYNPGVSILWGAQDGSYVGSEAIVLRSSTSPASQASSLQGYNGTLYVQASGNSSGMTVGIGTTLNMPPSDSTTGYSVINQLFNGLEPQGGAVTGNTIDCVNTNLCQIQSSGSNLVFVLPNSIFVLAPVNDGSGNYTVQTIALLNSQTLNITGDLQNVISVVSAQ